MPKDANQKAAKLVSEVTGGKRVRGESLLGSKELKKQLLSAKARIARRTKG